MVKLRTKKYTKKQILDMLEPIVAKWFGRKFKTITEPQAYAVPLIHNDKNILVSSPTGSGKTLTAFLSIINELVRLDKLGKLENRIYCVYISPLKALANDINRNLNLPLQEIVNLAEKDKIKMPEIRISVRTGDTTTSERQKMVRKPPHIFITTPESLAIVLSTKKFRESFKNVKWVIIDEIHELCNSKRGVLLSLTLERLAHTREFIRIGLSATQAPINEIAAFLAGFNDKGKQRPMNIIEIQPTKKLDLKVISPVPDINAVPLEVVNTKMYSLLEDLISKHKTTLIFTNTRSGTERIAFKLKELGVEDLEPHHGSLSKVRRFSVEERLKLGNLRGVVTSTSLELGIDIGSIDLVCQIGSSKTVAKALQRFGRSGHGYGDVSKGRFIVLDNDELVECAVIARCALDYNIDQVRIPKNSLDVLAQNIVGMSLEQRWNAKEAFALVKRSYCFNELDEQDFRSVIAYLSNGDSIEDVYSKIWYDKSSDMFGIKKSSRMIYYLNSGTIPDESEYLVFSASSGNHLGKLSEPFVERLKSKDIFLLGGKSYEFINTRGQKVFVNDASGKKPTVPSWTGEMMPMSYDLAIEISKFRSTMHNKLVKENDRTIKKWLEDRYCLDPGCAQSIVSYFRTQFTFSKIPTNKLLIIEGYTDQEGNNNIIFHFCFGRRVNDVLARSFAYALSEKHGFSFKITVLDNSFMLTTPSKIDLQEIPGSLSSDNLASVFKNAIKNSELIKQKFRHCASRSFMILRNYRGVEVKVGKQQAKAQKLLKLLDNKPDFPIIKEAYNEITNIDMDLNHAIEVLDDIENKVTHIEIRPFSDMPSPFSLNVVLSGVTDIINMSDRNELLKSLGRQILEKVIGNLGGNKPMFSPKIVKEHFQEKIGSKRNREQLIKKIIRTEKPSDKEKLSSLIVNVLEYFAPLTLKGLSDIVSLPPDDIGGELKILENESTVVSGKITEMGDTQYILQKDLVALENYGKKVYDQKIILSYVLGKLFHPLETIDDYFDRFGETSSPFDIFNHVKSFTMTDWKSMLDERRIVQGRFIRGRVKYIMASKMENYVSVYRQNQLNNLDRKILTLISSTSGMTFSEIIEHLQNEKIDKEQLRESINKLDSNLYVIRSFYDSDMWAPQNRYVELKVERERNIEKVVVSMIERFIQAWGPVSITTMQSYFGFSPDGIKSILQALETKKKIEKIISVGDDRRKHEMYIQISEIKSLDEYAASDKKEDTSIRILSFSDPFVIPFIPQLLARYGEGKYSPVMKGHELIGIVEQWERSDRLEIKNLQLDVEPQQFETVFNDTLLAIDNMMEFYEQDDLDVVAVRSVSGKSIADNDTKLIEIFKTHDYQNVQKDMMVKGSVSSESFPESDIINYILWRQHIHPVMQFKSEIEAVTEMHGLRSNYELALRLVSENYRHLRTYWKDGSLVHALGIPGYSTYCTMDDILLFKKAKHYKIEPDMKLILNMLDDRFLSKAKLLDESPLGLGSFTEALRLLQDGLYVLKNQKGQYYASGNIPLPPKNAEKTVVKNIFLQFGIFSAENLAMYLKFEWKMSDIRSILKTLEDENFLIRGYFIEGDDTLFWMVKEDFEKLRTSWRPKIDGDFILTPDDRLSHYLLPWVSKKFRMSNCFAIFQNGEMTCAFKAKFGKGEIILQEFTGTEKDRKILETFSYKKGLRIAKEEKTSDDEWDVISYVDKTYGTGDDDE